MKPDYGRTTITVPFELKKRMKSARALVNWSAVACEAFDKKLDELGPIEEITSIDAAVQRMKSIKTQTDLAEEPSHNGKQAGKHWAVNYATPNQLARIESLQNEMSADEWADLMTSRDGLKELARCMEPDRGFRDPQRQPPRQHPKRRRPGREAPPRRRGRGPGPEDHGPGWEREFWKTILDERPESPAFFLGFAEGALEIWKQIKDQL